MKTNITTAVRVLLYQMKWYASNLAILTLPECAGNLSLVHQGWLPLSTRAPRSPHMSPLGISAKGMVSDSEEEGIVNYERWMNDLIE